MKDFNCAVLSPASWQCWPESWLTHLCDVRSCRELGVLVEAASIYLYLRLDIYAYLVLHKCKWHWNCWYIFLWIWQLLWTGNRSNRSKKHCIRLSVSLLLGVMVTSLGQVFFIMPVMHFILHIQHAACARRWDTVLETINYSERTL